MKERRTKERQKAIMANYVLKWYPSHSCKNCRNDKKSQGCVRFFTFYSTNNTFWVVFSMEKPFSPQKIGR